MFPSILTRIRELVRRKHYVMTVHAEEELGEDELTIYDVESALLTGTIIERQKELETGELKYVVRGPSLGDDVVVLAVCKFGATGNLVIITVYVES